MNFKIHFLVFVSLLFISTENVYAHVTVQTTSSATHITIRNEEKPVIVHLNVSHIAENARQNGGLMKLKIRTDTLINFSLKKCNTTIIQQNNLISDETYFFDGPWIKFFSKTAERCDYETFEVTVEVNITRRSAVEIEFGIIDKIRKIPHYNHYKTEELVIEEHKVINFRPMLQAAMFSVLKKDLPKVLALTSETTEKTSVSFGKCDLVPKVVEMDKSDRLLFDDEMIGYIDRLNHLYCQNDLNADSFDLIVNAKKPINGTMFFQVYDQSLDQKFNKAAGYFYVVFFFIMFCSICYGCYLACKDSEKNIATRSNIFHVNQGHEPLPSHMDYMRWGHQQAIWSLDEEDLIFSINPTGNERSEPAEEHGTVTMDLENQVVSFNKTTAAENFAYEDDKI